MQFRVDGVPFEEEDAVRPFTLTYSGQTTQTGTYFALWHHYGGDAIGIVRVSFRVYSTLRVYAITCSARF